LSIAPREGSKSSSLTLLQQVEKGSQIYESFVARIFVLLPSPLAGEGPGVRKVPAMVARINAPGIATSARKTLRKPFVFAVTEH
jgi:hypothetical protein